MTYGTVTLDDAMGLLPFVSVPVLVVLCLVKCIFSVVSSSKKIRSSSTTTLRDETSEERTSSKRTSNSNPNHWWTSVAFLLFLSYLLSPLATVVHLKGKRQNLDFAKRRDHGLYDLIHGSDPKLQQVIDLMGTRFQRGPTPPLLLGNRHLQFLPWMIQNEIHRIEGIPYQRIELEVTACLDKTVGVECVRDPIMTDTITLDVFPPFDNHTQLNQQQEQQYPGFDDASPIIFFSPGLRCYSQDLPGTMIIRRAFGEGFRSVVVNRRGHTPDQKLQAPRLNLFGDVDDLEQMYWHIQQHWAAPHTPFFLHGISSGTATIVSALAEWDRRNNHNNTSHTVAAAPSFVGSVALVPGYDTSKVLLPERFKIPYNTLLTNEVKKHFILENEQVLRDYNSQAVDAVLQSADLQAFLNAAAPFAGYPNATEYYKGENPVNHMHYITTPKLVINSIDDPCCNIHNLYEASPYPQHGGKTYAQLIAGSQRAMLAVTKSGTHCPFLDSNEYFLPAVVQDPVNGGWMLDSWADRVAIDFYKATLEVYNERRFMQ